MNKSFILRFVIMFAAVFGLLFMVVWFYLSVATPANAADPLESPQLQGTPFETGQVQIRNNSGRAFSFDVELATTLEQQSLGLMHRAELAEGSGMLFIYKPPRRIAMWMKNTLIPLDMLFAGRSGTIFFIKRNAQPLSEDLIPAPGDVSYVLELPAGTADHLGIQVGDQLLR
jgi:uncharacterized membrane protein (UPF0127 family)